MRQLNTARVEQKKAIKDPAWQLACIQSRLNLLAEDLSLLVGSVNKLVIVFHLRLLLFNLDHAIQIRNFHWEPLLVFPPIHEAFVSTPHLSCSSSTLPFIFYSMIFTEIDMAINW